MGLFGNESSGSFKEDVQKDLAQIGGLGAGVLAGKASAIPIDAHYQKKLLNQGLEKSEQILQSKTDWDILFKLYKGDLTIDDLPIGQRTYYTNLFKEKKDTLNYFSHRPNEAAGAMEDLARGQIVPLFGKDQSVKMTRNFPNKVHSRAGKILAPTMGLAGFYGASMLYDRLNQPDENDD